MVPNLVRQNLRGVFIETAPLNVSEIDHHRLIGQPDHGEAVRQSFLLRLTIVETQPRRTQYDVPTPRSEGLRPGFRPMIAQLCE